MLFLIPKLYYVDTIRTGATVRRLTNVPLSLWKLLCCREACSEANHDLKHVQMS